jgi:hypothetical protein
MRHVAFRPHLSIGSALSEIGNDFVRLPSGVSLGEAKVGILEIGPLHNFLEKRWSEPSWVGQVEDDTEWELALSQEDSLGIPERQRIV